MIQVQVNFLSYYRLIAGMESTMISLPGNATVTDLIEHLKKQIPDIDGKLEQTVILVNQRQSSMDAVLNDKDEISMLYLIGGG